MIIVDDTIISDDIVEQYFLCDLHACHGDCCVEGDEGAPLEEEEIGILEDALDEIKPYMRAEGLEVVRQFGVFDYGADGDYVTPLVNNRECAFVYFENDIAFCAIEKAYREGKIDFIKPVSCHLYPIRLSKYKTFEAVNYHQWPICDVARVLGKKEGVPVYKALKEPLIRKYGADWYRKLELEIEKMKDDE
jgi:hypothetical protein